MKEKRAVSEQNSVLVPILNERRGRDHDGLFDGWFAIGALLQQCPNERDALQRLSQPHLVSHDAALLIGNLDACHAVVHEFYALSLMRSQNFCQDWIHNHVYL